jgi:hypothetical protein
MKSKHLNITASISFLLCLSLTLTNSRAATHVVTSPDDASLRAAIGQGGWIGFGFNGTVTLTNTIPITTNVFLDGSGADVTISGGNAVRLFSVAPGVRFGATNLAFANGTCLVTNNQVGVTADGGAVYNTGGNVTLVSCTLTNNNALCTGVGGVARGGAIFSDGGTVSLSQTSVSNNLAIVGRFTAMVPSAPGTNLAFGGAIYTTNGALAITGCTISSNQCEALMWFYTRALSLGGAIFQASGSVTIEDSLFALNQVLGGPIVHPNSRPGTRSYGGALAANAGNVIINHSQFLANMARGGDAPSGEIAGTAFGGAVYSAASLTARDSAFVGNQAFAGANNTANDSVPSQNAHGGAIYNSGTAGLNGCSFYSNYVQGGYSGTGDNGPGGNGQGGAIFNAAQLGATNCTLAFNSAVGGAGDWAWVNYNLALGTAGNAFGGGVFNEVNATFAAMNLTIASNACSSYSGLGYTNGTATGFQIANYGGTLRLHNSLIACSGTNANAYGTITDDGYNISSDGSAQLSSGTSYNSTDPKLGPLGDYGGPTLCMPMLAGSPAIDTGDPAHSPNTDQRGFVRPVGAGPDMGAYETSAAATGYTLDVKVDGLGIATKNPTNSVYPQGVTVTVAAVPNGGWYFDHWSGDASGSTNPLNVTMDTNLVITAHFLAFPCTITLQTNGQGTIVLNPPGGSYFSNSLVTATATPATGWAFDSWSGAISSTTNPLLLTINSNLSLIGTFRQLPPVNCAPPPSGLVGWWRAEGDGNDASGNNNTGTLSSGASFAPGKVGRAFSFDPSSPAPSFVIPDSPSLRLTNQLTIEAWINPKSTNFYQPIVAKVGGPNGYYDDYGYEFMLDRNGLGGQFSSPGRRWPGYGIECALPVVIGTWYHAAWTYDQSAMKLYWNGQPVATNVIGAHPIDTWESRLHISGDDDPQFPSLFAGLVDEASVYNRALSDSEIAAIYNAGSAGKCTNQQSLPYLSVALTPSNIVVSFPALPTKLYCLQVCTNLLNWTDLCTNGPFTCTTNVSQTFSLQGFKSRYFRLRVE